MGIAATPRYMKDTAVGFYDNLSPAAGFYTFFPIWQNNWEMDETHKHQALEKILSYSNTAQKQTKAFIQRQMTVLDMVDVKLKLSIPAKSLSPFMTGMGMEHPLENGFAFLQPYGLPYLAGSGVKGGLRQTARLLAEKAFDDQDHGFNDYTIETLFGSETSTDGEQSDEFQRGALTFWDVIIQPKELQGKMKLTVDILTPHQSHYLQGDENPHDSGQPVPVPFLAVGAGASFHFHITANPHLLGDLKECWQDMLQQCFQYTTEWFGFGAKNAVGYGVLKLDQSALNQQKEQLEKEKKKDKLEAEMANLSEQLKLLKKFEKQLPEDNIWKGKVNSFIPLDIDGKKYGFAELFNEVKTWQDKNDLQVALKFFEDKLPNLLDTAISKNKNWKPRLSELRAKLESL